MKHNTKIALQSGVALASLCLTLPPAHAYTRLILAASNTSRQYELLQFTNPRDACNFYGASSIQCKFANEYFAGWSGSATIEFARLPAWSTRAHLYGGGAVAMSTPAQLAAALNAGTTLSVPLNGVTLTACFGTDPGCTTLTGLTTYEQIASVVEFALNASPVILGTITGTIAPVSMDINVLVGRKNVDVKVNSVGKMLYNGAYVCGKSQPCLSSSPDQINQIESQMNWASEKVGGPGWYSFYSNPAAKGFQLDHEKETINGSASYGVLTVKSYDSGLPVAAPTGINGANIPATSYVWECISLCGQVGARWIVNNATTISTPEKMNLTSVQTIVQWNGRVNGSVNWGYFDVQQTGAAQPIDVNTIGYATGSAASILGLSENSPGYPGVLYSQSYASSPGTTVKSVGGWLDSFRSSVDSTFTSCEIDQPANIVPPPLPNQIQDWAIKQHPPVHCPASWVTKPVSSTPSLISCINHEPSCQQQ